MNTRQQIKNKIFNNIHDFKSTLDDWKNEGYQLVFTNGCFDILHAGHLDYLFKAADLGEKLIIGLNADVSVKMLKGESRPIIAEDTRAMKLAAMQFVDAVILFKDETPLELIKGILPDIITKGGDYKAEDIVGYNEVKENGGEVIILPFLDGFSTTKIIEQKIN
jgi:rfaE bifunctional protein nucleotidyltransferase chain/domain